MRGYVVEESSKCICLLNYLLWLLGRETHSGLWEAHLESATTHGKVPQGGSLSVILGHCAHSSVNIVTQ